MKQKKRPGKQVNVLLKSVEDQIKLLTKEEEKIDKQRLLSGLGINHYHCMFCEYIRNLTRLKASII